LNGNMNVGSDPREDLAWKIAGTQRMAEKRKGKTEVRRDACLVPREKKATQGQWTRGEEKVSQADKQNGTSRHPPKNISSEKEQPGKGSTFIKKGQFCH